MNDQEKAFVEIARTGLTSARASLVERQKSLPADMQDALQQRIDALDSILEQFADIDG